MAKKIVTTIKLQILAGQANPAPPVGPALGAHGVNIMEFCNAFNAATKGKPGFIIPVVLTIYQDRSFTFITKTPPAASLLKRAAGVAVGSAQPNREKVARITSDQIREIADQKMKDLNANSKEAAAKIIEGTARSMGIEVVDEVEGKLVSEEKQD